LAPRPGTAGWTGVSSRAGTLHTAAVGHTPPARATPGGPCGPEANFLRAQDAFCPHTHQPAPNTAATQRPCDSHNTTHTPLAHRIPTHRGQAGRGTQPPHPPPDTRHKARAQPDKRLQPLPLGVWGPASLSCLTLQGPEPVLAGAKRMPQARDKAADSRSLHSQQLRACHAISPRTRSRGRRARQARQSRPPACSRRKPTKRPQHTRPGVGTASNQREHSMFKTCAGDIAHSRGVPSTMQKSQQPPPGRAHQGTKAGVCVFACVRVGGRSSAARCVQHMRRTCD